MIRRVGFGGCGCGCGQAVDAANYYDPPHASPHMGGVFEIALNAAGSFVGNPALGSQLASQAAPAWGKIKETPDQIAARVVPDVRATLQAGTYPPAAAQITPHAAQIAEAVAPYVAAQLAAEGYEFAPGTVGAELQDPSVLNAFGGENSQWVLIGGVALGALVILKAL